MCEYNVFIYVDMYVHMFLLSYVLYFVCSFVYLWTVHRLLAVVISENFNNGVSRLTSENRCGLVATSSIFSRCMTTWFNHNTISPTIKRPQWSCSSAKFIMAVQWKTL